MKKILPVLAIAGLLISACAHKGVVKESTQLEPQRQTSVTQEKEKNAENTKKFAGSKESSIDSMQLIRDMQAKMKDIHFDFDGYAIKNNDKPVLKGVAETLRKNGNVKVTIEGNCDERGTVEYNLALGDRRAYAAKEYLSSLGIASGRLDTVSYGKEKPLCTESNEVCWAKNRRDHFALKEGAR